MTLLQLEYFCKLAETEHISRAAKELCISQTALSNMIISLEKDLGVRLFDRTSRSIRLNPAGKMYLEYVTESLNILKSGRAALQDFSGIAEQRVRVAGGSLLVWGPMLYSFQRDFPQYILNQQTQTGTGLQRALHDMEIDFIFAGANDINSTGFLRKTIKMDNVYLCVSEMHPLAQRESVYLEELKDESFISLPKDTPWQTHCDILFKQAGVSVKSVLECDYTLRSHLISLGLGVALTSDMAIEVGLLNPNRYVLIKDSFARHEMSLFWNPKQHMNKACKDFMEYSINFYQGKQQ